MATGDGDSTSLSTGPSSSSDGSEDETTSPTPTSSSNPESTRTSVVVVTADMSSTIITAGSSTPIFAEPATASTPSNSEGWRLLESQKGHALLGGLHAWWWKLGALTAWTFLSAVGIMGWFSLG